MSRNGHVHVMSAGQVSFSQVADLLRQKDPATAFTRVAEILLDRFQDLKAELGAAATIKLAIDAHKHGLMCEVAMDKTRTAHDAAAYDLYQKYLAGDTDIPVAAGLRQDTPMPTVPVDEETLDAEDPEQYCQQGPAPQP